MRSKQSQVYIVLFGNDYGYEDESGISPTENEYNQALKHHLDCLAFIKGDSTLERHSKEKAFIIKAQGAIFHINGSKHYHNLLQKLTRPLLSC